MLWLFLFQPMIEVLPSGKLAALGFAVFCFIISVACFPGPLRRPAFRFLGGCMFLVYVIYAIGSERPCSRGAAIVAATPPSSTPSSGCSYSAFPVLTSPSPEVWRQALL